MVATGSSTLKPEFFANEELKFRGPGKFRHCSRDSNVSEDRQMDMEKESRGKERKSELPRRNEW